MDSRVTRVWSRVDMKLPRSTVSAPAMAGSMPELAPAAMRSRSPATSACAASVEPMRVSSLASPCSAKRPRSWAIQAGAKDPPSEV
jgi:hypothetical protein